MENFASKKVSAPTIKIPPSHNQTVKAMVGVLLSFGKSVQKSETAKAMTESLRKRDPKAFYKAVKLATRLQNQSRFAVEFASTLEDPHPPSFGDYLVTLYGTNPKPLPFKPNVEKHVVNDDHLHLAIKRLSSGKAVGVDGLRDLVLKHAVKNVVGCKDKLKMVM